MILFCPQCSVPLPEHLLRQSSLDGRCSTCGASFGLTLFPALFRPKEKIDLAAQQSFEGEATCYEHQTKRAVAVCGKCGRFVCALCEVNVAGQTLCPNCLQSPASGPIQALEQRRTLFDSITLALATLPALLIYPILLTSPAVLFICFRYWRKPTSIIPRSKWRFVAATSLALTEIALIVGVIVAFLVARQRGLVPR